MCVLFSVAFSYSGPRFQFAGGADAVEIAVEPDFQEQARMIGRPAIDGHRHGKAEGGQIELLDKFAQKPDGVIAGHPIFERRGGERNCWP